MNLKQKLITFKMNLCSILNIGKTRHEGRGISVGKNGGGLKDSEFFCDGPIKVAHYN